MINKITECIRSKLLKMGFFEIYFMGKYISSIKYINKTIRIITFHTRMEMNVNKSLEWVLEKKRSFTMN